MEKQKSAVAKHILYVTAYPDTYFYTLIDRQPTAASIAAQKLNRLIIQGFAANQADVEVLCVNDPLAQMEKQFSGQWKTIHNNGILFHFCPQHSAGFADQLKHKADVQTFIKEQYQNDPNLVVFLDILAPLADTIAASSRHICAMVTDLPAFMYQNGAAWKRKLKIRSRDQIIAKAEHCVFMTRQTAEYYQITDPKKYTVIEGMVSRSENHPAQIQKSNIILYGGALTEDCGIHRLTEAFLSLNTDWQLHLYGYGAYVTRLKEICQINQNIRYGGIIQNDLLVEKQKEAMLLVNPRPDNYDYTKYSFPSKNMEYMASGTPLLTTDLPGMPAEYRPYVLLFPSATIEGIRQGLDTAIHMNCSSLNLLGQQAKEFVLNHKNNVVQTKKILDMLAMK